MDGRVAVVTGGASGIGEAIARALGQTGAHVVVADRDVDGANRVAQALPRAQAAEVDVRDATHVADFAERVAFEHGGAAILVNNAGVACRGTFAESSLDDLHHVLDVNLWGVLHSTHAFLPQLARQDEAHIVNIASIFGVLPVPGQASYAASKFAVRGFSESLAEELRGGPIGVTTVFPGGIATPIAARARSAALAPPPDALWQTALTFFERRAAPPESVARAVVRAIQHRRERVLVTPEAHIIDLARRVAPQLATRAAAWWSSRDLARRWW